MAPATDVATRLVASVAIIVVGLMVPDEAVTRAAAPLPTQQFETTRWRVIALAGKATPAQNPHREAHLIFQAGRVSGSDGCNRITGTYQVEGDGVTFGPIATTQMACADSGEIERGVHAALKGAGRWKIAGNRLVIVDAAGLELAVLESGSTASPAGIASDLEGTAWQLIKFQGSDDTTLTPDDGAKYTIEFGAGGRLTARIDCNRGRGTWKSSGSSQVELGPLALTRARCPEGSLHDQIVKQWGYIRSYVIRDGHLFLALMADGGIYEFEPSTPAKPENRR